MKTLKRRFAEWLIGPRCYIVDMDNPEDLELHWALRETEESDVDEDATVVKNLQMILEATRYEFDAVERYNEVVKPLNSLLKSNGVKLITYNHTKRRVEKKWSNEYIPIVNLTVESTYSNLKRFIKGLSNYAVELKVR